MVINVENLSSFFDRDYVDSSIESLLNHQADSQTGYLDILIQRARRNKAVRENKIFDYIAVENDPYFSRNANNVRDKFETFISQLSLSTSIVTVINANIQLARIEQFIPTNLRTLLYNFQTLADTNINVLSNIQRFVSFKQIEEALFADLRFQFLGNTITFGDVALFADRVLQNLDTEDAIENNGLRPLLNLGVQNFLPNDILDILQTAQYIDSVNTLFDNDSLKTKSFNDEVEARLVTFSDTTVRSNVDDTSYDAPALTLVDPMGLKTKQAFQQEFIDAYHAEIQRILDAAAASQSTTAPADLVSLMQEDATTNVNKALELNVIGLPKMSRVARAVSVDTNTRTVDAINNAIDRFVLSVITDVEDLKQPAADERPIDYLVNIKRNLEARINFTKRGATTEQFVAIDNFLENVVVDGKITTEIVEDLNSKLDVIFNEEIEIKG